MKSSNTIWKKSCPECGNIIIYKTNAILKKSIKLNRRCYSCTHKHPNIVNKKFGKLKIIKQYILGGKTLVDYECDCGTVKYGAILTNVKNQCSCKKCQKRGIHKKKFGEAAFNLIFLGYKNNAKHRGLQFLLTKKQFRDLTKKNCFYCGNSPSSVKSGKHIYGKYVYNGIDRKDNSLGYTVENSVPCCKFCNLAKSNSDFNDFILWIRSAYETTKGYEI